MPKSAPGPAAVRVLPMPVAPFEGVPHVVQDVTPEEAARLTAPSSRHSPTGRFVTDPALLPPGWSPPDPDGLLAPPSAEGTATQPAADAAAPSED